MDIDRPLALLANLSPRRFMQRHWQKKPLLARAAIPGFRAPVGRARLFELAARDDAESRLIRRGGDAGWRLDRGPFARRALPTLKTPGWTLLVQGVDLLDERAHELLQRFRFVPDARLDDLMISWASDGGGVGPHFDRFDVFLLQAQGKRRWRIGRQRDLALDAQAPLKILSRFRPTHEFVLEPGDLLYLPPRWAHEGTAIGPDCLTYSIGFRAPTADELARELLLRLADSQRGGAAAKQRLYADPRQPATHAPAAIPDEFAAFGRRALERLLGDPREFARAFGEALSEPKPSVWFDANETGARTPCSAIRLDRRTRMLYDERHVFINGESLRIGGSDARLWKRLADARFLSERDVSACSASMRERLAGWTAAGWLHEETIR